MGMLGSIWGRSISNVEKERMKGIKEGRKEGREAASEGA